MKFIYNFLLKLQHTVEGIPSINLPDVCTNSPVSGKAFCIEHCKYIKDMKLNIPTGLKDFLSYCGALPKRGTHGCIYGCSSTLYHSYII